MKTKLPTQLWVVGALLLFSQSTFAALLLNGIATHSEFNNERFIGALYLETPTSDAEDILNIRQPARIELRITAQRYSTRQLSKMWVQGMTINNSPAQLSEEEENMVYFTSLIQNSLSRGDRLRIDYTPGMGTSVSLNGKKLGHILSENFFNMLLTSWIGEIPLSNDFKDNLLHSGIVSEQLISRFDSVSTSQ